MKQYWQKIAAKVDGLTLRERVIVFAMSALVLVMLVNSFLLDAQFATQKQLSQKIRQEQSQIAAIQAEIQQKVKLQESDPDAMNRQQLDALKKQFAQMHGSLLNMQKGLVSPDKMGDLLEDILKRNGRLRIVSLKKIPVVGLTETIPAPENKPEADKVKAQGNPLRETVYKHGVEITLQGGYLDMVNYMAELESMPSQLFWGKVRMSVDEYPKTTLTLTLFTLSLDRKWLNI